MELGNMIFGHSRGRFPVEERTLYRSLIQPLFDALRCDGYGIEYENDVFEMHPYCWCEKDTCLQCTGVQKNFRHKSSGFELAWYKYAMRDAYTDRVIRPPTFIDLIRECVDSIPKLSARELDILEADRTVRKHDQSYAQAMQAATPELQKRMLDRLTHNSVYGAHVSYQHPVYTKDVKGGGNGSTEGR